ncbi:M3 family metallopeptidase [Roseateles violae]|uniref:M3 family metallopeptidase n=1 Tax=Roseateles violae TaxID=3058042 RepID=A0ABT8DU82_9BURK|nr:M3 family metallopeptidase [Pelomonas sp. PFR6]MDN3919937.1 M3 family metallopeptidase [Pelomonas sp. PFR6]
MKTKTLLSAACLAVLAAGAIAQTMPAPAFPKFKSADEIKARCDEGLAATSKQLAALEGRAVDAGWIAAYDAFYAAAEDAQNSIDFLQYVHPDKALRDAAQACSLRWADFNSSLKQNEKLYQAMKAAPAADAIERELLRVAIGDFEDGGVALPAAKRERAKKILDRITEIDQQFNKNIREAGVKVAFSEAELKGVPENVWKNAKRDEQGRYVLGVDYPSYVPVLQSAELGSTREKMWWAKVNEGGDANLKLLHEIASLRHEYAALFGFANYVDFNLRRKMAKDGSTAWKFLDEVKSTVIEGERADLVELRAAKAKHLGTPLASTEIKRWDASYYSERLRRERYSVDQEAFRPYFPPEQTLAFAMRVIEKLMGVRYTKVAAELWHPETQAYVVSDAASGKPIAQMYVDLYPREGKYNHAAVWSLRGSSSKLGRTPVAALVVNFDRKGLTIDEVETLLHELGHAVHNNLSNTRYAAQAGTSVMQDFVEAPSQMLEDWVFDKKVLKLMSEVCASCKPVPDAMVDQAVKAKNFAKGTRYGRQHLYASYDLALHGPVVPDPLALWAKMEGETPLGHEKGSKFPAGFAHLTAQYGAGYYGYLWSLVLAMDLRTAFKDDKLSPGIGLDYRNKVLGQGSQRPAPELVTDFLGRDWNSKAFFEDLRKQ